MPTSHNKFRSVIALGSNLEPRMVALQKALDLWRVHENIEFIAVGRVYETEPEPKSGFTFDTDFLNTCLAVDTSLSAAELIGVCKEIEKSCGRDFAREYRSKTGDRVIDCDLIFHGDTVVEEVDVNVPHPRWAIRIFVVLPLNDIRDHLTEWQREEVAKAVRNLDSKKIMAPYGTLRNPSSSK